MFAPMELSGIVESLQHKSILVTGATGFLAKIFVEKVLRIQPQIKKLFLLIRAADSKSAAQRLQNEVIGVELFRPLRDKWGSNLESLISDKVTPVPGDIACENLGVKDSSLNEDMWNKIDIIVNFAATTNFDDRYDVSLGINALGAKHLLDFAKKCVKVEMLLHVSTAYVAGERTGLLLEKPFYMGETLNGSSTLDINVEMKLVEERLNDLRAQQATKETETYAMKEMGIKRAKQFGWPNTYVFTKAMGEMILGHFKENLPVVIIRPTIITSTYKEPFPGWVEGVRTIDSMALSYGKGKLTCFLGDPNSIIDIIPGDMVVNSIIVAMVAHANQPSEFIYHVGSSARNPIKYSAIQDMGYRYFSANPCYSKDGKPVKVGKITVLETMENFRRYMTVRYILPLKVLQLVNEASCKYFNGTYSDLSRKIKLAFRLVELYEPYLFFKGVFDDKNTEKLRMALRGNHAGANLFYFDPKSINWEDYFMKTHLPGAVRHVLK